MMIKVFLIVLILLVCSCRKDETIVHNKKMHNIIKKFRNIPEEINGWKKSTEDKSYTRQTIFDYINGAGEVYLTYDFKEVFVRKYDKENEQTIEVAIFDMGSSEDAYGIFSYELQDEDAGIGQDSEYGGGMLRFRKSNFFVSIFCSNDTPVIKKTILHLGECVSNLIDETGDPPSLIKMLPEDSLSKRSIKFFHKHFNLERIYFIADENILHLDETTDAVFAKYIVNNQKFFLLLIFYPDEKVSDEAFKKFKKVYVPDANSHNFAKLENNLWTGIKKIGKYIAIILDVPDKKIGEDLLKKVEEKIIR